MDDDVAIRVEGVTKDFILPRERVTNAKSAFIRLLKGKHSKSAEVQHALKGVTFEVKKGEFFGIVGRNGSGKSTLLKIISGIYQPTKGKVYTNGKLVPFIELGVGFHPELTGRENVYLNGAMLGFSEQEVDAMYDEIVEFAELERFMDQKLKNYSSGMKVRLAFSVAIKAQADILILDEVLAVGDEAFQRKCYQYFAKLKRAKKTVILVTHSMDNITQFCTRAMLLHNGRKQLVGTPLKVAQLYKKLNDENPAPSADKKKNGKSWGTEYVDTDVRMVRDNGKLVFDIDIRPKTKLEDAVAILGIYKNSGELLYRWTSDENAPHEVDLTKRNTIRIEVADIFPVGEFTSNVFIRKRDRTRDYAVFNDVVRFRVTNETPHQHAVYWKIPERTIINGKE